jgi:hypothetical protein
MSAESLKERMKEFNEGKIGSVEVTGADLAKAAEQSGPAGQSGQSAGEPKGTVQADVPEEAKSDVFTHAGATSDLHQGMSPSFLQDKVDITEEDRDAFLKAIVTGGRYERPFSLFGGKLTGVFRCRKIAESDGIIAHLSYCVNSKKVDARIEYLTLMRNAMLAAQVKSLRGLVSEDFPELQAPFGPTRSADGKSVEPPAWLGLAESWGERPEAIVTALHNELQLFEKRYWAMVMDAGNQNFWNPAASI